jgi:hypothetical protein
MANNYPIAERRKFASHALLTLFILVPITAHFVIFEILTNNAQDFQNSCFNCDYIQQFTVISMILIIVGLLLWFLYFAAIALDHKIKEESTSLFLLFSVVIPISFSSFSYLYRCIKTSDPTFVDNSIQVYLAIACVLESLFVACLIFVCFGHMVHELCLGLKKCCSGLFPKIGELFNAEHQDDENNAERDVNLDQLPRDFQIHYVVVENGPEGETECKICNRSLVISRLARFSNCHHVFHYKCINSVPVCPVCALQP